jgi:pyruvate dehydrogenase E1 component
MKYLQRPPRRPGRLHVPTPSHQGRSPHGAAADDLPGLARGHRRARDFHHHGLRAHPHRLLRDKALGRRIVPIVPDEARTFGMEGLFRQVGIYSSVGQLYEPVDSDQVMYYREDKGGQILEEGINEAGAFSSWLAAATSYSTNNVQMMPVLHLLLHVRLPAHRRPGLGGGRLASARLPARRHRRPHDAERRRPAARGRSQPPAGGDDPQLHFLRPDLPLRAGGDPPGRHAAHGPGTGRRLLLPDGDERELQPPGPAQGRRGSLYRFSEAAKGKGKTKKPRVQLMGSGTILREVIAAAELLDSDWGVAADVWSATSFNELRREAQEVHRWNLMHPDKKQKQSYVEQCLDGAEGPVIASTDYMRAFPDQIRPYVSRRFVTLGTDGFGRSDSRAALRRFFEVDRHHVVLAALKALADDGVLPASKAVEAIKKYGIDAERPNPVNV